MIPVGLEFFEELEEDLSLTFKLLTLETKLWCLFLCEPLCEPLWEGCLDLLCPFLE
jgi:hypothetical protein